MRWFRTLVTLILGCAASAAFAYRPSATSPYTYTGCDLCGTYSHERVGDGNFHQPGCEQSGAPLYWCDCSIGFAAGEMLQAPVLTVEGDDVVLEYWARNIYCNPPPDGGNPEQPNAVSYRIQIIQVDPVTLATVSVRHTIAPYWEHGKVTLTDLSPACGLYRAVYLVDTIFGTTYVVSSDVVGATGTSTAGGASCLLDMGPCPSGNGAQPSSGVSPTVGGPVNVGSGNMVYSEPLFSIAGPGASALQFELSYNSRETSAGALGPGFTHTFDQRLTSLGSHRLWRGPEGLRVLWVLENHPPTGQIRRPVYPGDATGTMTVGTNVQIRALDGSVTELSSAGRWVKTTDRWANAVTGAYTGSDLTSITDAMGRTLTLAYTGGKLTSVTDGDGNQWRFQYDAGGRLEKVFDPLHTGTTPWRQYSWVTYAAGSPFVLAKVSDDSGAVREAHQYDAQGRAISSWSGDTTGDPPAPGANARDLVTLAYDSPTQTTVTSTIDTGVTQASVYTLKVGSGRFLAPSIVGTCASCGQVEDAVQFTFDGANHPLSRIVGTGAEQVETRWVYDANGMVTSMTEAFGKPEQRVTTFGYTKAGWPSFVTSTTETSVAKPGQSKVTNFSWNAGETLLTQSVSGFLASTDPGPTVYTTTTSFDARHRPIQQDGSVTGARTAWTWYGDSDANLNRRGRLQLTTVTTTAATTLVTTSDDYDVYGTPRVVTDANGVTTQRTLDGRGRTLTIRSVKPPGDANEPSDYVTTSTYDGRDRLTAVTRPRANGSTYRFEDGTDRLLQTIRVDATGNERERIVHALNAVGNKTSESYEECTTPAPACSTWVVRRTDSFGYDAAGRLTSITHPDATTVGYAYDTRGNLASVKDERHAAPNTLYTYDALNRLTAVTQKRTLVPGSDVVTGYVYDAQDDLTGVTDPNGNVTTNVFDDFGRMQKQVSPVTGTTTYAFDAAGNLLTSVDANGAATTRTYDLANRLLTATSSRAGLSTESVVWAYDAATAGAYGKGRVASMTDPSGSTTYLYERRGLLRSEARTIGGVSSTSSFGYDVNGNRSSIGYPSGSTVAYTFDFADRPLSAAGTATYVSAATYYPFGPQKTLTFGNGTVQELAFDDRYSPVANALTLAGVPIASYSYTDDGALNVTSIHDALGSTWNRDFAYDDLNRLVTASSGGSLWGTGSYSYDAMGNMLTQTLGTASTTFSYLGTTPKLASVTSGTTTTPVSYDSAGNETGAEVTRTISARNLIRQIETLGSRHTFVYDGRGVRVLRAEASKRLSDQAKITRSVYTPELQLLSTTRTSASFGAPTASRTTEIVWFGGRPVAQLDAVGGGAATVAHTFADHLGTPLLQTNGVAAVVWRAESEPYGRIFTMRTSTADAQPLRFPGQEAPIAGDSYNVFRWYRAGWGRYTQVDPLGWDSPWSRIVPRTFLPGIFQGFDTGTPYAYALGSPLNVIDPTGEAALGAALPLAGGCALADGPFPIGDAIALTILVGAAIYDLSQPKEATCSSNCEPKKKQRWTCTAQCNTEVFKPQPGVIYPPRLTGIGYGHSEDAACTAAKAAATGSAPPGSYGRHCKCTACWKN